MKLPLSYPYTQHRWKQISNFLTSTKNFPGKSRLGLRNSQYTHKTNNWILLIFSPKIRPFITHRCGLSCCSFRHFIVERGIQLPHCKNIENIYLVIGFEESDSFPPKFNNTQKELPLNSFSNSKCIIRCAVCGRNIFMSITKGEKGRKFTRNRT